MYIQHDRESVSPLTGQIVQRMTEKLSHQWQEHMFPHNKTETVPPLTGQDYARTTGEKLSHY